MSRASQIIDRALTSTNEEMAWSVPKSGKFMIKLGPNDKTELEWESNSDEKIRFRRKGEKWTDFI